VPPSLILQTTNETATPPPQLGGKAGVEDPAVVIASTDFTVSRSRVGYYQRLLYDVFHDLPSEDRNAKSAKHAKDDRLVVGLGPPWFVLRSTGGFFRLMLDHALNTVA
jgi:hypothetical protein